MKQDDLNEFYDEYVGAAKLHGEASTTNPRVANKQYDKLTKIYRHAQKNPKSAASFYLRLMEHEDPSVRGWACAHSLGLGVNVERAKAILTELSQDTSLGILGFEAEMTLKVWEEKGGLKF